MAWALITVAGELEVIDGDPTEYALFQRLGDAELVSTRYATWAVCGEHAIVAGLPANEVAGAIALMLGAEWRQLAGPVGFVGRLGGVREGAAGPLDKQSLSALVTMHGHVSAVLNLPEGSGGPVPEVVPVDEIRRAAQFMRTGVATWV